MKKRLLAIVSCIFILGCLAGCGKSGDSAQSDHDSSENNAICDIYYPKEYQVVKADEPYQIKKMDSLSTEVEEVMNALIPYLDAEMITFQTYMIDSNNVIILTFNISSQMTNEYFVLTKSSIVQTFSNIEGVTSISFVWQDADGKELSSETLDSNSFCYE